MKNLGKVIITLRKGKGLTRKSLAMFAFISPAYVGQIEKGEKSPSLETLERISFALDVTLFYLLLEATEKEDIEKHHHNDIFTTMKGLGRMLHETTDLFENNNIL